MAASSGNPTWPNYEVQFEAPIKAAFGDIDVYACGAWCQGVSLAQIFRMLDQVDIAGAGA